MIHAIDQEPGAFLAVSISEASGQALAPASSELVRQTLSQRSTPATLLCKDVFSTVRKEIAVSICAGSLSTSRAGSS